MATTQERLDEARAAYHKLQTGTMARVVVDQNGERVEFTAANRQDLYDYIKRLEGELGTPGAVPANIGPAGFFF